ncbi:MAG TPA: DUF1080 domain-containing protein [Planctomycetaceae bacterium]|jgi:hypothetical protein|nr:DUF1080 domain-containing protein [Planctomycetaceae bacterium]
MFGIREGNKAAARTVVTSVAVFAWVAFAASTSAFAKEYESGIKWLEPKVIQPGEKCGDPPSDAIILFDGKDLSKWVGGDKWEVRDGYAIGHGHDIKTKEAFGDCQLHIEWATPSTVSGSGQGRGNSGVYLMEKYEVQILDSYGNKTYFDGQAAGIYKQHPPMVNCCRKPGEWQTYDIVFNAPRFGEGGRLVKPGYVTVLQNGVLVQNHTELLGSTFYEQPPKYEPHPPKGRISLQYHHNAVRFRNIWVREIHEPPIASEHASK